MNLHPEGTEYVHIPIAGAPTDAGVLEASFDGGTTWHDTVWNDDKTEATILVSGPNGTGGGVTLPEGRSLVTVRLVDTPERIIRKTAGSIDVQ